jgi:hypothetical protein
LSFIVFAQTAHFGTATLRAEFRFFGIGRVPHNPRDKSDGGFWFLMIDSGFQDRFWVGHEATNLPAGGTEKTRASD